jgi:hypothetical protein
MGKILIYSLLAALHPPVVQVDKAKESAFKCPPKRKRLMTPTVM